MKTEVSVYERNLFGQSLETRSRRISPGESISGSCREDLLRDHCYRTTDLVRLRSGMDKKY
jgi:hypothetical protein